MESYINRQRKDRLKIFILNRTLIDSDKEYEKE